MHVHITYREKDDINPAWSNSSQMAHEVLIRGVIGQVTMIIAMYHVMLNVFQGTSSLTAAARAQAQAKGGSSSDPFRSEHAIRRSSNPNYTVGFIDPFLLSHALLEET